LNGFELIFSNWHRFCRNLNEDLQFKIYVTARKKSRILSTAECPEKEKNSHSETENFLFC